MNSISWCLFLSVDDKTSHFLMVAVAEDSLQLLVPSETFEYNVLAFMRFEMLELLLTAIFLSPL